MVTELLVIRNQSCRSSGRRLSTFVLALWSRKRKDTMYVAKYPRKYIEKGGAALYLVVFFLARIPQSVVPVLHRSAISGRRLTEFNVTDE